MSDFGTCDFGAITPELVFRSLISGIQNAESCGIRIVAVDTSQKTLSTPIACSTPEYFWSLLHQTLMIADDGQVAIRANVVSSANGAGLGTCGDCQDGYLLYQIFASLFSKDANGVVYFNIISIT